MNTQITIGGATYNFVALRTLQVAAFYDSIDAGNSGETKMQIFTRSLRVIYWALSNAKCPIVDGLDEDAAIAKIDGMAEFAEIDDAFATVIQLTGLNATKAGEAPATDSALTKSIAA